MPATDQAEETTMTSRDVMRTIDAFCGDTSRSMEETQKGLEEILDHVMIWLEALDTVATPTGPGVGEEGSGVRDQGPGVSG